MKYIVCDACYILSEESYDKLMEIWFPKGLLVMDVMAYGGPYLLTDKNGNPISMILSTATHGGDCVIDGIGCDAGNFSVFSSETWDDDRKHMFRYFCDEDTARAYQKKLISLS